MRGQIRSVEVSYIIHATEDESKVREAVKRILGINQEPIIQSLEGHFGNEILRAVFHLTDESANHTFRMLFDNMPEYARKNVVERISSYIDEHSSLYLRLDKQNIVQGRVELSDSDAIRIKIKPRLYLVKGSEVDFFRRMIYLERR